MLTVSTWEDAGVPSTRDDLVAAAADLLEEGGPGAVTLREVGARAGVSRSAPYRHFAGKEDLLAAVAARGLRDRHAARMRRRAASPAEAVRADLLYFVRGALAHPALFRLTYGPWTVESPELADAAATSRAALVDLVIAAQADGALPAGDPDRVTALLTAVAHGACQLALSGHLSRAGKGHAAPADLVDDLLGHLGGQPADR
jgi:AcrR family transcriptional regulator